MIIFQNKGLVPLEAFTTFGMSAKPGSTNPIGKFGTGLKYAVAVTLRLGGVFKLFRGNEEYEFYTKDEDFRGKTFSKIRMRKRNSLLGAWRYSSLPFTTELGKHWKPWMAIRELEANCRDENGRSFIGSHLELAQNASNMTVIMVDCLEMQEAYENIGDIFLVERMPIYEDTSIRVYEGESKHVFYRGMRVTDLSKPSLFTYELKSVDLTEDRTSMYTSYDNLKIMNSLLSCNDKRIVDKIVDMSDDYHEGTFDWDQKKPETSPAWIPALSRGGLSSRFAALRDNLEYGLGEDEDVDISMPARDWQKIVDALYETDLGKIREKIESELKEAGWRG